MRTSKTIESISKAYLKAQTKIESAKKDSANPFFRSKYADINSVLEACKGELNSHGISILQPISGDFVQTILMHESGEWFMSKTRIVTVKENDPQAYGSAITYARRYGLQSMLGMMAEDDDGERAMSRQVVQAPRTPLKQSEVLNAGKDSKSTPTYATGQNRATEKQVVAIGNMLQHLLIDKDEYYKEKGVDEGSLTVGEASEIIGELSSMK
jgi:hypothetical protein